jgi:hypothetical protein
VAQGEGPKFKPQYRKQQQQQQKTLHMITILSGKSKWKLMGS